MKRTSDIEKQLKVLEQEEDPIEVLRATLLIQTRIMLELRDNVTAAMLAYMSDRDEAKNAIHSRG